MTSQRRRAQADAPLRVVLSVSCRRRRPAGAEISESFVQRVPGAKSVISEHERQVQDGPKKWDCRLRATILSNVNRFKDKN